MVKPSERLAEAIKKATEDCKKTLPPGVPLPFVIHGVSKCKFNKRPAVLAVVEMFDRMAGQLIIGRWDDFEDAITLSWEYLPGGDISWDGTQWVRVNRDESEEEE